MRKFVLAFLALLLVEFAFTQNSPLAKQAAEWAETDYSQGNLPSSINNYKKAIEYELKTNKQDSTFLGESNFYLGILHAEVGNIEAAINYYKAAGEITRLTYNTEGQETVLRTLGKLYLGLSNYTEAIITFETAYGLAVELDNVFEQEVCLNDIGLAYYYSGQLDEALETFNKALKLTKQLEDKPEEPVTLTNNIGLVYYAAGDYQKALKNFTKSVEMAEDLNTNINTNMQLVNIATCYNNLGEQEKSIESYQKALSRTQESGIREDEATLLGYMGMAYYQWGLYDQALEYHNQALQIYSDLSHQIGYARCLNNIAMVYSAKSDYQEALKYYLEAYDIIGASGDVAGALTILNNIGETNRGLGKYDEALGNFNKALEMSMNTGLRNSEAIVLNNIGMVHYIRGDFQSALSYFTDALEIFYAYNNIDYISTTLNNIGMINKSLGEFDQAIDRFEESYNFSVTTGNLNNQALTLNNIGMVYALWGKFDDALDYYAQALEFSRENGIKLMEATINNNIGLLYIEWEKYDDSHLYFKAAYDLSIEMDDKALKALVLNNVGLVFFHQYDLTTALNFFKRSIKLYEDLGTENTHPETYNNIGEIYYWRDNYDTALIYLDKSLKIAGEMHDINAESGMLNSLGNLHFELKKYDKAIENYEASLAIKEKLRETATGDIKRDYLAENLFIYNNLISTYIDLNKTNEAFRVNEQSKARYLLDQLGADTTWDGRFGYKKISLPAHSLVISFANTNWSDKVVFSMKPQDTVIHAVVVSDTNFFKQDFSDETMGNDLAFIPRRGATVLQNDVDKKGLLKGLVEDENFDEIINYYRLLLSNPIASNKKSTEKIGRALYDYLIKPIEAELAGVKNLIIVPDGPLSNIPFECLIDENGHYLAESYTIGYTPSVSVLNYLGHRTYDKKRFEVLAVGNPAYTLYFTKNDTLETREELMAFRKQVDYSIARNEALGQYYGNLGYGEWPGLPGTEKEIDEIAQTYGHAVTLTGEQAAERNIKALSDSGKLKQYNLLHFATHGITILEAPELSALVLTQVDTDTVDDGYLTMGEIANLRMEADFVNLSACETGLGKIYGGEGVVGLTQAFMVAGANGLSVSLWKVGDESTALFMTELYKLVSSSEISYAKAMTEIKRRFIQGEYGEKYTQPFYWGPFVYYGKE